jgi:hypothetical protein
MSRVLKANHGTYRPVLDQIVALERVEQLRAQPPLNFEVETA